MTEHTPGPWKAEEPRFGYQTVRQDPADWDGHGYQLICTVPQSTKGSHYGQMFRANAALIAAAPGLLKALEFFADPENWRLNGPCDPNSSNFSGTSVAEKAISAVVEGRSP